MDVSVIVPIYNGREYIEHCCHQLANQTLRSLEFVLVNDGSTDGSETICKRMAERYTNCVFLNQTNQGVSVARNNGIAHAHGMYIGFMDVDDEIEEDMFETLYRGVTENGLDLISMEPLEKPGDFYLFPSREEWIKAFFESKIRISMCNKLIRKDLIEQPFFPVGKRIHEDAYAAYKALCNAENVGILNVEKYHYIHREGSSSRAAVFTDKYLDAIKIADWIYDDAKIKFPELEDFNEGRKARTYLRISKIYYLRKAPTEYRSSIREMKKYLKLLDRNKLKIYFRTNDFIRYMLCINVMPLFKILIKTVDKK